LLGSFRNPGADFATASVDYGDGSGSQPLEVDGRAFLLRHRYDHPGTYLVRVTVDDDAASGGADVQVQVLARGAAVSLVGYVTQFAA
jgi:hypothetical protein